MRAGVNFPQRYSLRSKLLEIIWLFLWLPKLMHGSVAERSKALVLGTSLKGRGFESHRCQIISLLLAIN